MKKEPLAFKEWLLRWHLHQDTPIGDLARDVEHDTRFPESDDFLDLYEHISSATRESEAATVALMSAYAKWWYYRAEVWNGLRK